MPQAIAAKAPAAGLDLETLRTEIDRIDAQLLELMEERLLCSGAVAAMKAKEEGDQLRLRPAREAQVIARLADRATRMPRASVTAIWRELMGINLQAQQATHIVIHCPLQPVLVTDQARLRFGGAAPIVAAGTPQDALDRARNREAIAVIEFSPLSNWWVELFHDEALTIFDCLRDRHGRIVALVIGRVAAQHVTSDTSFLVLGDGALRRRTEAGDKMRTLAICGNLRLCVRHSAAGREAAR
ncbi:MAG: chorismate mutase [Sphingomonadaceae bacterium]|nr:chorismate mutase [Sphingomonadaceae bacterium]